MKTGRRILAAILVFAMLFVNLPAKKAEAASSASLSVQAEHTDDVLTLKLVTDSLLEFGGFWIYLEGADDLTVSSASSPFGNVTIGSKKVNGVQYPAFTVINAGRVPFEVAANEAILTVNLDASTLQVDKDYHLILHVIEIYDYDDEDHEVNMDPDIHFGSSGTSISSALVP